MTPAQLLKIQRAAQAGKKATSGLSAAKEAETIANMQRAGDLYLPGIHYADPLAKPTMKMSEALGASGSEGKTLRFTEADRSRVFGSNRGGVGFSALQHYSLPHKDARTVWGYGNESTARKKINQGDPKSTIWTTYAGSPTQHKSNTVVVKDAIKELQAANKAGTVSPQQIKLINYRIREAKNDKGKPLFPEGFDITDPKALSHATTFDRRAILSDALMGLGIKKPMKSVEFKKANPEVSYSDASNLESILARETDPALVNANTFDVGPHLFEIEPNIIVRPDLNEAFPFQVTGTDYGLRYEPTPFRMAAPEFTKNIPIDEAINAWKMSRGNPSQFVSEEYLTNLQKENFAKGGLASMAEGGTPPPPRKPISALIPLTDAAAAVQDAYKAESKTYSDKGAGMDILNRGFVSDVLGGTVDLFNLPLQGLDYVQSKIPFLSKPASVTDPKGERVPKFALSTDKPFAGSDAFRDVFKRAGVTSGTERPIAETATSLLLPFAPSVAGKTARVAKASAPYAGKLAQEFAEKTQMGFPLQMNVMKQKGGNWLTGEPEKMTEPMKVKTAGGKPAEEALAEMEKNYPTETLANMQEGQRRSVEAVFPGLRRDAALNKWIDQKLNRYVKNEMATPEDQIRLGIERREVEAEALKELNNKRLAKMEADIQRAKAEGKDTTLSENDLEAAREKFNDEYTIASRGLYHRTAPEGGWTGDSVWEPETVLSRRVKEGFPERGMGKTPASTAWEIEADVEIRPFTAEALISSPSSSKVIQENPFLSKIDPKSKVYGFSDNALDVGLEFRHMIDEVKDAMDPASNLPKSLRISPKDLEKMTVDDVSALSGKISAWRDVQKTKADLQLANNPAVHTFKEYPPENNPKGVSWRQIKRPEGMPDEEAEKFVREATKYEGDIMRHCVGGAGHCEPLLKGEVEIYSLRDAKGEPHVTIEVQPIKKQPTWNQIPEDVEEKLRLEGERIGNQKADAAGYSQWSNERDIEVRTEIGKLKDDWAYNNPIIEKKILEIKGKNNRKPSDDYIPFVQDFIKSGQWSDVGDIANTGLRKADDVLGTNVVKELRRRGEYVPPVLDFEEAAKFHELFKPGSLDEYLGGKEAYRKSWESQGYAKGGAVTSNDLESRMNAMLAKGYAKGGAVSSDSLEDKMNKMLAMNYAQKNMADGGFTKVGSFKIGGRISLMKH